MYASDIARVASDCLRPVINSSSIKLFFKHLLQKVFVDSLSALLYDRSEDSDRENTVQQANYFQAARGNMRQFLPKSYRTVLEIGCGEAGFSQLLTPGAEVWGVEPSRAADVAAQRLHKVLRGKFDDVSNQLPDGHFDLVVCNDVIEHMVDHDAFLEAIKAKLAVAGVLVGSIPNFRYYVNLYELIVRGDFEYEDSGIRDRTHLRFFTEKSLKRTLQQHGFLIDEFAGINSDFDRPLQSAPQQSLVKALAKRSVLVSLIGVSLGRARDVQYQQFGFRVRPA